MATQEVVLVPPTPADTSQLALLADLQYLEPMGSEALNRKLRGITSRGVYRGFTYSLPGAMTLRIGAGNAPGTAVVEVGQVAITVQQVKTVDLTVPANFDGYLVLEATYGLGVITKQVSTDSTIDAAALKLVTKAARLPDQVILYSILTPPGTLTLLASHITETGREYPPLDWARITTGKPTTLAGYGIVDAAPLSHVGATGAAHGAVTQSVNGFMIAADKAKLDGMASSAGLGVKATAKVATTANLTATYANGTAGVGATLTNSGTLAALSIDGLAVAANDRVLVKNQTTTAQNGIYTVTNIGSASVAWILTRAADADTNADLAAAMVSIEKGTAGAGKIFANITKGTDTIGTTAVAWYEMPLIGTELGASKAVVTDSSGRLITHATVTAAEVGYLAGVTSSIQTQLSARQPVDATLTAMAGVTTAADKIIYFTGLDTATSATLTSFARTILDDADAATARATLGVHSSAETAFKVSLECATTANLTATYANGTAGEGATLTNSGTLAALSIDGVAPAANARVLVKNQTAPAENGVYVVTNAGSGSVAWILTRAADADTNADLAAAVVTIDKGTANGSKLFTNTTKSTDTIGTTAVAWYEVPMIGTALGASKAVVTDSSGRLTTSVTATELGLLAGAGSTLLKDQLAAKQDVNKKGQPDGYAGLDSNGKIAAGQLPALAITDTFVCANQAAMLALTAEVGDVAIRTDESKSYILTTEPASTLANWQELRASQSISGNAATATKLATARQINGTDFDGSGNITTANWGTARTLTIGNAAKSVNGAGNESWSLAEIGAAPAGFGLGGYCASLAGDLNTVLRTRSGFYNADAASVTNGFQPSGWCYYMNMAHGNAAGYNGLLAMSFNGAHLGFKTVEAGADKGWKTIYHTGNKPTSADVGLGSVNNWAASGAVNLASDTTYATAGAVKSAYDLASGKLGKTENAVSATKWLNGVTITLAGDATGAVSFDGATAALTLTVAVGDDSHNHAFANLTGKPTTLAGYGITDAVNSTTGNAPTATKLATARQINGTNFDGTANITTANWGTARTLTIGNAGKSVNGGADVAWSLDEIRAASAVPLRVGSSVAGRKSCRLLTIGRTDNSCAFVIAAQGDFGATARGWYQVSVATRSGAISVDAYAFNANDSVDPLKIYTIYTGTVFEVWGEFSDYNNDSSILICSNHGATFLADQFATAKDWTQFSQAGINKFYTSNDKPTSADVGLGSVNNWAASGAVNLASDTTYATAGAVKSAYDLASGKLDNLGNAASATKWLNGVTITLAGDATGAVSFDGATAALTLTVAVGDDSHNHAFANLTGKPTTLAGYGITDAVNSTTGNAPTATKLATARQINGTNFDGSGNITTANWGTARTLTIGNAAKSVNGAGNVSWSLDEIGAVKNNAWFAQVKLGIWSAICELQVPGTLGGKAIVTVGHTRGNVVVNAMFLVSFGHSGQASITQLESHGYTQIKVRPAIVSANNIQLEILDDAAVSDPMGAVVAYTVRVDNLFGSLYPFTAFTASTGTPQAELSTEWRAIKVNNNKVYHAGFKPTAADVGALQAGANAVSASKWATARTLTLTGGVSGSVSFDGSGNISLTTTVGDDSHKHSIDYVTGLRSALNLKADCPGGWISFGGNSNAITTAQFIELLTSLGAFSSSGYWTARGSWTYAANQVITDTGLGNIHLAGAVVEVIGPSREYTIRITTPTTTSGGLAAAEFIYVNNGSAYAPGWRRSFNTSNPPTAAQVGAMAESGSYGTVYMNNWFRSTGPTGWYNETYGGGIHMSDTEWVRTFGNKKFHIANGEGDALNVSGGIYAGGSGSFADVTIRSDRNLKSNFQAIEDGLGKVLQLTGQIYDKQLLGMAGVVGVKREAGLIAQDVEAVLPLGVHRHDDGYLSISQTGLNALFVEAIKGLADQIAQLRSAFIQEAA